MHTNLAYLHRELEEFDLAHHHLNVLLDIGKDLDDASFIQRVYNWRCDMSLRQGLVDSAAHWRNVALDYSALNGDKSKFWYWQSGDVFFALNDLDEASKYYDLELGNNGDNVNALLGASKCAKAKGDYALALSLMERYHAVEDSLREMRRVPAISLSETRQEVSLMEKEERRRVEQEREAAKSRNFLQYSAGLLVIVILLLLLNLVVKLTLPSLVIKAASFITVLTLFEFALVYLDPTIEAASGGQPLAKLGINLLIATVIFPLHTFIEGRIAKAYG